ncbi:hypothetical protein [Frankia sp. CcWB3]
MMLSITYLLLHYVPVEPLMLAGAAAQVPGRRSSCGPTRCTTLSMYPIATVLDAGRRSWAAR